jgi:hypothetical protein
MRNLHLIDEKNQRFGGQMMRTLQSIAIGLTASLVATAAWGQNLLINPDFDWDVAWWEVETYVSLAWSPIDASGHPWSGSAEVTNAHPGQLQGTGISQCVSWPPVIPGATYDFAGSAFIPDGQSRTGDAMIGLRWYDGPDCAGSSVGDQPRRSTAVVGSWERLEALDEIAPAGAVSVLFLAFPSKIEAGGTLVAHFDELHFSRSIFHNGFETGDRWDWSTSVETVVMATPYVDQADIDQVSRVFCQSGNCPWNPPTQLHDGIDLAPAYDLVPFQSGLAGVVIGIDPYFNTGNGNWQVNLTIEYLYERSYRLNYAFEPMSPLTTVRDQQLAEIVVQVGQQVAPGDLIGRLVAANPGAHVHWGFFEGWWQVCPEPYLSDAVRTDLLNLIQQDHPSWNICH